jgi:HSP90 family molecular chaperone
MTKDAYIQFSPRILDHLGVSAYDNLQKCLTELVVNAYDADATKVEITLPDVIDKNAVLEIVDNGYGMTETDVEEKFLFIGRNKRDDGQRTRRGSVVTPRSWTPKS